MFEKGGIYDCMKIVSQFDARLDKSESDGVDGSMIKGHQNRDVPHHGES